MSHRYISQLTDREPVDEIFVVADKQLRTNRQGNLYLQMRLSDRTGTVNAMMWNANEKIYHVFDNGDYLHVQGTAQFYNGALQVIVSNVDRVPPAEIDESDYVTLQSEEIQQFQRRLIEILGKNGGYLLAPAHIIQSDTTIETIKTMIEAAKEFGIY